MAKRRIHIETHGAQVAKVFYDSEISEFIVRLYDDGILNPTADYFTSDKDDAIDTARAMVSSKPKQGIPIMKIRLKSIEVRVSRDSRDNSGTHWNLFAMYPNRLEAYQALDRAKEQGYTLASIIARETVDLTV